MLFKCPPIDAVSVIFLRLPLETVKYNNFMQTNIPQSNITFLLKVIKFENMLLVFHGETTGWEMLCQVTMLPWLAIRILVTTYIYNCITCLWVQHMCSIYELICVYFHFHKKYAYLKVLESYFSFYF